MKYSCRARRFEPFREYGLEPDRLVLRARSGKASVPFTDISEIVVFKEKLIGSSRSYWACTIQDRRRVLKLSAAHRFGAGRVEDRTASYIPFIKEFERRSLAANPRIRFINDEYRESVFTKLYGQLA